MLARASAMRSYSPGAEIITAPHGSAVTIRQPVLPNMRLTKILPLLLSVAAINVHAECAAQRSQSRPHLVELYTSEGCSSCPPADDWLRQLPAGGGVVALAFHVDYWDYLGWRDRFADPRYSKRQQAQAGHDGASGVYTPQIVLDGHAWSGWYRAGTSTALVDPVTASDASMRLSADAPSLAGTPLRVRLHTEFAEGSDTDYRNYIALTEDGLSSQVRAGENRGALLHHDHVVRSLVGPLSLANADAQIALPSDLDIANASLIAFAQRPSDGAIAQVVALPLRQCR